MVDNNVSLVVETLDDIMIRNYTPYLGMTDGTSEALLLELIERLDRCKANEVKRYFMYMITSCFNTQKIVERYDTRLKSWIKIGRRGKKHREYTIVQMN